MLKAVIYFLILWSVFALSALGISLETQTRHATPSPYLEFDGSIENSSTTPQETSEKISEIHQQKHSDLLTFWLTCEPFNRLLELLKDASISLHSHMKASHQRDLTMLRRARLWIRKLKMQMKRIYRSCPRSLDIKQLNEKLNTKSLFQLMQVYINLQNSLELDASSSQIKEKRTGIEEISNSSLVEDIGRDEVSKSVKNFKFHNITDISGKRQRKHSESALAKILLNMITTTGDINVTFLLNELRAMVEKEMTLLKARKITRNKGSYTKVKIVGLKRLVPTYFLSVAVGARIIKNGKMAELTRSPRFLTLSRGLSPSILRYGGTYANCLIYDGDSSSSSHGSDTHGIPEYVIQEESQSIFLNGSAETGILPSGNEDSVGNRPIRDALEENQSYSVTRERDHHVDEETGRLSSQKLSEHEESGESSSLGLNGSEGEVDQSSLRPNQITDQKPLQFSLQNDEASAQNRSTNETDCVFDFPYHHLYQTKPKNNSTYNVLAALMSARGIPSPDYLQEEPVYSDEDSYDDAPDTLNKILSNFTMTVDDWVTLTDFAKDVGMTLLFDVNQIYRKHDSEEWDAANARQIFQISHDRNDSLIWQLGNEPNAYRHVFGLQFSGERGATDFDIFHQELTNFFDQPFIVGPDVTRPHRKLFPDLGESQSVEDLLQPSVNFLKDFLSNLKINISAISWHHYYTDGRLATIDDFLSSDLLDQFIWQVTQIVEVRDQLSPGTPIWLTETSSAFGGGAKDLSDRYADGFPWLDKLGMAASMGIDMVARQTLIQGRYALIDDDLYPEPSYWLSYIYKSLVGVEVLNLAISGASRTTRIYAHCQKRASSQSYKPGNIVVFGMNLATKTVEVSVTGVSPGHHIEEYLLEPEEGNLQSSVVLMNGRALQMISDVELPELTPTLLPKMQHIRIPPQTFGFWVFVNASVGDCM